MCLWEKKEEEEEESCLSRTLSITVSLLTENDTQPAAKQANKTTKLGSLIDPSPPASERVDTQRSAVG
jgi:hypothetical protein